MHWTPSRVMQVCSGLRWVVALAIMDLMNATHAFCMPPSLALFDTSALDQRNATRANVSAVNGPTLSGGMPSGSPVCITCLLKFNLYHLWRFFFSQHDVTRKACRYRRSHQTVPSDSQNCGMMKAAGSRGCSVRRYVLGGDPGAARCHTASSGPGGMQHTTHSD